jgi:ammonia channel protein AmtB
MKERGQLAIRLKYRLRYDDSLDVVAIHGVGGVVGLAPTGELRHYPAQSGSCPSLVLYPPRSKRTMKQTTAAGF